MLIGRLSPDDENIYVTASDLSSIKNNFIIFRSLIVTDDKFHVHRHVIMSYDGDNDLTRRLRNGRNDFL